MHKQFRISNSLRHLHKTLLYPPLQFLFLLNGKLIILRMNRRHLYPFVGFLDVELPLAKLENKAVINSHYRPELSGEIQPSVSLERHSEQRVAEPFLEFAAYVAFRQPGKVLPF